MGQCGYITREYFSDIEWSYFEEILSIAVAVCRDLTHKYGYELFTDSRWPATGCKIQHLFRTDYIRITLNHNYLDDKMLFFELRHHTVIKVPFVYNKTTHNYLLCKLTTEQLKDKNTIYDLIDKAIASIGEYHQLSGYDNPNDK
jgi:hypothetical protein